MEQNIEYNVVSENVHVEELNWGEPLPSSIPTIELDLILAADCVYYEVSWANAVGVNVDSGSQPAFPLLVQTLCDLIPVGKVVEVLFCWKKRRKASVPLGIALQKLTTHPGRQALLRPLEEALPLRSRRRR